MKNNRKVFLFRSLVVAMFALTAQLNVGAQTALTHAIDSLLEHPMFQRSQVAVLVYDLDGDSVLYDRGSLQLMRPASVMKVLTATTALDNLGAAHNFTTTLSYVGTIERDSCTQVADSLVAAETPSANVLRGDLYIRGGFDPLFGPEDMRAFMQALEQDDIRRIDGNIYADLSFKDTMKWGEGWCWDDKEATLTPLLYNGRDAFMTQFFRALDAGGVVRPTDYSRITDRSSSPAAVTLCTRTHTVSQMLTKMMKDSNNLFAESLFYQLAFPRGAATSANGVADLPNRTATRAAEQEYELITRLGLSPGDYTVADGSGLSLYNYLTPQLVVRLLRYAWSTPSVLQALYPSLPVAGRDGTLKSRMKGTAAEGNVHAKTGTLRKVSTLAGYATAASGKHIAFCIFNQGILNLQEGRDFQDRVCLQLVK